MSRQRCCVEGYCDYCADNEAPAPEWRVTFGGLPPECCFANGNYVFQHVGGCSWMYEGICGACDLHAWLSLVDGHYMLRIDTTSTCYPFYGTLWFQVDLGVNKPNCKQLDVDLTRVPGENEICDFSNATCHLTAV